ncbi:hypothetical protein MPSEU_000525600 [Mayamaea pseudoterrestris]|nr:hypothetical protein MPSEU_000525600 [Mayamaea pseudoterrestris]
MSANSNIDRNVNDDNNKTSSSTVTMADELMARDMQLALDLQTAEEFAARETSAALRSVQEDATTAANEFQVEHGFFNLQQQDDHMLFVNCTLDDRKVNLLVDSGASMSAMSLVVLRKLGLMDKLNASVSGACGGVGSANIVGVVENLICLVGHVEFRLYFLVLDSELPSVVLGLDQMRRFQCVIDMESDCLCFGGKDGVKVPFLNVRDARKARKDCERMIRDATARRLAPTTEATRSISSRIPSIFRRHRPGRG